VFDRGTIGELGFDILLHGLVQTGALSQSQFDVATSGWGGDRYVAWSQGDRFCVRDRVSETGSASSAALLVALRALASSRPSLTVEGGAQPVLTSCA